MTKWRMARDTLVASNLWRKRLSFQMDPGYQREGSLWSLERRQLFIDSVVNGFDVPPLYLHRLNPPEIVEDTLKAFAVIDGRQRLEALWSFLDGEFPLAAESRILNEDQDEATDVGDSASEIAGLTAPELSRVRYDIFLRVMNYEFAVTYIDTDDTALVEEMFFRLNEGVPLSPAEKRYRGTLLRGVLTRLLVDEEALSMLRYKNRRRVHEDLLLRLLFLEKRFLNPARSTQDEFPDLKKRDLDEFASSFSPLPGTGDAIEPQKEAELNELARLVMANIAKLRGTFGEADPLLRGSAWFLSYYLLTRHLDEVVPRDTIIRFWEEIEALKGQSENAMTPDQVAALELAGPLPATTTGSYFHARVEVLAAFVRGALDLGAPPTVPEHSSHHDAT